MPRPMIGCKDAVEWVRSQQVIDVDIQERVINRMEYEFEKDLGTPPTYHKGKYGSKYDSWTCGNCGHGLAEPYWKFCPNRGYKVGRKIYGKRADQIIIDEVMEKLDEL